MADLQQFIKESLEKGKSKEEIASVLREVGWHEKDIENELATYADVSFPVAVPKPKPYLNARDAFMYLVLFFALYMTAFNVGAILFEFVNKWFVDPMYPDYYHYSNITFSIAAVIITAPVYVFLARKLHKEEDKNPVMRHSKVKKWLTYLTLFVSVIIMISDLISFLYRFLEGDLTMRFVLKSLIVLFIVGGIFLFYKHDLSRDE